MQWTRWLNRRNPAAREHLIVHYSPLVKFVAGRVGAGLPSSVDPGDLVSSGVFGLIDAIDRFDPDRGVKFETFAVPRIRGAVYDGLRKLDWVPRSVRSRARSVERAFSDLEHRLGRGRRPTTNSPSISTSRAAELTRWLAAIASTTVGPLDRAIAAGAEPAALDGPGSGVAVGDRRGSASCSQIMRTEIKKLPDREKLVLSLYYDEGLTLVRDRPGPRGHREPGLADPHEIGAAPAVTAVRRRRRLTAPSPPVHSTARLLDRPHRCRLVAQATSTARFRRSSMSRSRSVAVATVVARRARDHAGRGPSPASAEPCWNPAVGRPSSRSVPHAGVYVVPGQPGDRVRGGARHRGALGGARHGRRSADRSPACATSWSASTSGWQITYGRVCQ